PKSNIRISISDTGPGIAPKNLERMFNPFERIGAEQTETEGTGLGLAVAKKLMEAMGGTIGVESALGQGSTFWLELPRMESPLESAQRLSALEEIMADATKTGTVLYVEDNLFNLQLVEQIFTRRPAIKLITALQGRLAVDLACDHTPDLILLDLHLPDMHGADVLRLLRAEPKTQAIPVIVLSADATPSQIERLKAAGAQDYLTKPLDVRQFLEMLDKMIGDQRVE
ncbi:MAG: hypothetical protein C0393_07470, partial [Anaerolinea sp.]|nr:hypothetical protein [Anaerolinea sp.]